jgi:hypothetical protein
MLKKSQFLLMNMRKKTRKRKEKKSCEITGPYLRNSGIVLEASRLQGKGKDGLRFNEETFLDSFIIRIGWAFFYY